jgi:hypothetical protein
MKRTAKYYSKNTDARKKKLKYDKEFQKRPEQVKKRVEANKANREAGTYGNGDGKDFDHAVGKMIDQSVNRGRAGEGGRKRKYMYGGKVKKYKYGGKIKYVDGGSIDTDPPKKKQYDVEKIAPRKGFRQNEDGSVSTHLMTYTEAGGKFYAYPTLFQENGEWFEKNDENNWEAFEEAKKRGEIFEFENEEDAALFSEGSWKKK